MDIFFHHVRLGRLRAQVSDEDADLCEVKWHLAGGKGGAGQYAASQFRLPGGRTYRTAYLHRVVAQRMGIISVTCGSEGGHWRESIDHLNGDKLDCRRENLRLRDRKQQMTNLADRLRRNNTSGTRGVSYIQGTGKWYASGMADGRTQSLGHYQTQDEAVAARRAWDERREVPPPKGLRSNNTSGIRGVSYVQGRRKWYASVQADGKTKSLGYHLTKEEAIAARRAWDMLSSQGSRHCVTTA